MKRAFIYLFLPGVILFTSLHAREDRKYIDTFVSFGSSIPSQPALFSDYWRNGFNFGLGVSYRLSPKLSVVADLHYNIFTLNHRKYLHFFYPGYLQPEMSGGSRYIFSLSGNMKWTIYNEIPWLSSFISGGVGMINNRVSGILITGHDIMNYFDEVGHTRFAGILGMGIEINPEGVIGFIAETRYTYCVFDKNALRYTIIRAGIRMRF